MYCIFKNDVFTPCVGNMAFAPTVYQTAESLTEDQRRVFDVYEVFDERPPLQPDHQYVEQFVYRVERGAVIRAWGQAPIPMADREKAVAEKVDQLWKAADTYVTGYISGIAVGLLTIGVISRLPKCLAVSAWTSRIWDEYYRRKALLTYNGEVDTDFSAFGPIPHSIPELRAEIEGA